MRNYLLLILFFVVLSVMFVTVFVPKLEQKNTIDQLNYTLYEIRQQVPDSSKVYLLQNGLPSDTEIYYKSQFVLAPRTVVSAKYHDIPGGAYVVSLKSLSNTALTDSAYAGTMELYTAKDHFFHVSLLKKN